MSGSIEMTDEGYQLLCNCLSNHLDFSATVASVTSDVGTTTGKIKGMYADGKILHIDVELQNEQDCYVTGIVLNAAGTSPFSGLVQSSAAPFATFTGSVYVSGSFHSSSGVLSYTTVTFQFKLDDTLSKLTVEFLDTGYATTDELYKIASSALDTSDCAKLSESNEFTGGMNTFTNDVQVDGLLQPSRLTVDNDALVLGGLQVNGSTSLGTASTGALTANSLEVGNDADITGDASVGGAATVTGALTAGSISTTGRLYCTDNNTNINSMNRIAYLYTSRLYGTFNVGLGSSAISFAPLYNHALGLTYTGYFYEAALSRGVTSTPKCCAPVGIPFLAKIVYTSAVTSVTDIVPGETLSAFAGAGATIIKVCVGFYYDAASASTAAASAVYSVSGSEIDSPSDTQLECFRLMSGARLQVATGTRYINAWLVRTSYIF